MSADTDRLIAQARRQAEIVNDFECGLFLSLAAALEAAEAAEAQRDTLAEAAAGVIAAKDAYMGASETGWRSWDSPSCAPQQQRYTKAVKALEAALAGVAPPEEQP